MRMTLEDYEKLEIEPIPREDWPEEAWDAPGLTAEEFEEMYFLLMGESWGVYPPQIMWPSDIARLRMLEARATYPELRAAYGWAGLDGWIE